LADADPNIRGRRGSRLSALAQFARPQLMDAMDSAGPSVRSQIAPILLHRLWIEDKDSLAGPGVLVHTPIECSGTRRQGHKLSNLAQPDSSAALVRIL